ncbi:hypothetical protein GCM10008961_02190 [Deinococcus knuensis]|uniref:Uncharacterized protein n=1 Tax=Deinococcus knuensis TaxID=1837380 RepID=A0ABQ2SAD1_9DEIO|nr:hypothetical protein GCM10008961_02190 [Deinococcus knuensis]
MRVGRFPRFGDRVRGCGLLATSGGQSGGGIAPHFRGAKRGAFRRIKGRPGEEGSRATGRAVSGRGAWGAGGVRGGRQRGAGAASWGRGRSRGPLALRGRSLFAVPLEGGAGFLR